MGKLLMSPCRIGLGSDDVTAVKSHVLSGYTAITRDSEDEPIEGTMPENGSPQINLIAGQSHHIVPGHYSGGVVTAETLASQTGGATADSSKVLNGYTYWKDGVKQTGAIPSITAKTIMPGTVNQEIAAKQYLAGTQTIKGDANLIPANILYEKSIYGKIGTCRPWVWRAGTPTSEGRITFNNVNGSTARFYKFTFSLSGITPRLIWIFAGSSCSVWCADYNSNLVHTFGEVGNIWILVSGNCSVTPTKVSVPVQSYDLTPIYRAAGY